MSKPRGTVEGDRQRAISEAYREYYLRTPDAIAFQTVAELDDWLRKAGCEPPVQDQQWTTEDHDKQRVTMAFAELVPQLLRPGRGAAAASPAQSETGHTMTPRPKPYSPYSGKDYPDVYGFRVAKPYKGRTQDDSRSPPNGRAYGLGVFNEGMRATQRSRMSASRSPSFATDSLSSMYLQQPGTNGGVPITPESLRQSVEGGKFTAKANELATSMNKASAELHKVERYNKHWLGVDRLARDRSAQHDEIRAALEKQQREVLAEEMSRLQAIEQLKVELRDEVRRGLERELGDVMRQDMQVALRKEEMAVRERLRTELRDKVAQELRHEMRESVRQEEEMAIREHLRTELREEVAHDLRDEMKENVRRELEYQFRREEEDRRKQLAEDWRRRNLKDEATQTVEPEMTAHIPPIFQASTSSVASDTLKRKRIETEEEGTVTEDRREMFKRRRRSTSAEEHSPMEGIEVHIVHPCTEPIQEQDKNPIANGDDSAEHPPEAEDLYPKLPSEDEDKVVVQTSTEPVHGSKSLEIVEQGESPQIFHETSDGQVSPESQGSKPYSIIPLEVVEETPVVAVQAAETENIHYPTIVKGTQPESKTAETADGNHVDVMEDIQEQVKPVESGTDADEAQPENNKHNGGGNENADAIDAMDVVGEDAQKGQAEQGAASGESMDRQGEAVDKANDVMEDIDVEIDDTDAAGIKETGSAEEEYQAEEVEERRALEAEVEEAEQIREGKWVGRLGEVEGEDENVEKEVAPFEDKEGGREEARENLTSNDDDNSLDYSEEEDAEEEEIIEEEDVDPEEYIYYNNGEGEIYDGFSSDYMEVEEEDVEDDDDAEEEDENEEPTRYNQQRQLQPKGEPVVIDLCDSDDEDDKPVAPTGEQEKQQDAEPEEQIDEEGNEVEAEEDEIPNGNGYDADEGSLTSASSSGSDDETSSMDDQEDASALAPAEVEEGANMSYGVNESGTPTSTHPAETAYQDNSPPRVEKVQVMEEHFRHTRVLGETINSSSHGHGQAPNRLVATATAYFAQHSEQTMFLPYTSTSGHQISSVVNQRIRHEDGIEEQNGNEDEQHQKLLPPPTEAVEQVDEQVNDAAVEDEDSVDEENEEDINHEHKRSVRIEDLGSSFIRPKTGLKNEEISKRLGMEGIQPAFSPARAAAGVGGVDQAAAGSEKIVEGDLGNDHQVGDEARGRVVSEQVV